MSYNFYEVHEAEWQVATEWFAYEADMGSNPYGEVEPSETDLETMVKTFA